MIFLQIKRVMHMLKKLSLLIILMAPLLANADKKRDVIGLWETEEKGEIVLIDKNENGFPIAGKLERSASRPDKVGMTLMTNFTEHKDGWNVTIYSPRRDKNFDAVIHRKDQELNLEVDAGFFTHHIIWTAQSN